MNRVIKRWKSISTFMLKNKTKTKNDWKKVVWKLDRWATAVKNSKCKIFVLLIFFFWECRCKKMSKKKKTSRRGKLYIAVFVSSKQWKYISKVHSISINSTILPLSLHYLERRVFSHFYFLLSSLLRIPILSSVIYACNAGRFCQFNLPTASFSFSV